VLVKVGQIDKIDENRAVEHEKTSQIVQDSEANCVSANDPSGKAKILVRDPIEPSKFG
jgi:hypothetical protein